MSDAVTQRVKRAASKAKGLCAECVCRPRVVGMSRCETCRKRVEDRRRTARVGRKIAATAIDAFHVCCQMHTGHRVGCGGL